MMAVIAADELDTASSMPSVISPVSLLSGDLGELIGDELSALPAACSPPNVRNRSSISVATGK